VIYIPRPDNEAILSALSASEFGAETGTVQGGIPMPAMETMSLGSYVMRHDTEICCEAVDQEGNVFQVRKRSVLVVILSVMR